MPFRTVTATVLRPLGGQAFDRLGMPVDGEPAEDVVEGVLVTPGPTSDMDASRPDGVTVACTMHLPKSYTASVEGCRVMLPEPWHEEGGYRVVGRPLPYMAANTPGRWNRAAELEVAHG